MRARPPLTAVLAALAAIVSLACHQAAPPAAPEPAPPPLAGPAAHFDWFRYEGRDPVYAALPRSDATFYNPILPGFYPDPSITRAGDDYYLVTSSFSYFPGVPIFHSRDLVNWRQIGHVLDRPSQLRATGPISRGVFAPTITYHDGTFYMITTIVDGGGNIVVTASDPAGPWSDPVVLGFDGIDPSLFFDDDGRAWILNNGPPEGTPLYEGHRALWIQEFDAKTLKMTGPRTLIVNGGVDLSKQPIWIEGPHIFRKDGTYYLIAAEGGTAENHSEVVFRGRSVLGPWEPYRGNPILTQRHLSSGRPYPVTSTGHADFVETSSGEWWAVFLGARPYREDHYNTGRETFLLPVTWRDGWPHILQGEAVVPYALKRPSLKASPVHGAMPTGNFVQRDDFGVDRLPHHWMFLRTPSETWYDLAAKPGWLTLRARTARLGRIEQPSYVARRQQHAYATASTALQFDAKCDGDRAGIAVVQGDQHYYLLTTGIHRGERVVRLEKSGGAARRGETDLVASLPLNAAAGATVYLKVDANGATYDFSYATEPDRWRPVVQGADGTWLSTKTAGGFVGTTLGPYAHTEAGCTASAEGWVGTWATSPQLTEPANLPPAPGLSNNTLRQVVRVSVGGTRLRAKFSNEFGISPVSLEAVRLAPSTGGSAIDSAAARTLTFGGSGSVTIEPGQTVWSDPFAFALRALSDVAITIRFGATSPAVTGHPGSRTTSYIQPGDAVAAAALPKAVTTDHWYIINALDVAGGDSLAAVVTLGNSITDGRGSGTNRQNRWPDELSRRLRADPRTAHVAVLNHGIGGNCVLRACLGPSAMVRFERDVLEQSGVKWLIVLEGINDIGGARGDSAAAAVTRNLIAAYRQMIERAHARGIKVYGATLLPFGTSFYDSPEREAARAAVNRWIRTSGEFDAVIDLEAALRDPANPTRLRPEADTGDHLHPNETGHRLMAEAIDLALFARAAGR